MKANLTQENDDKAAAAIQKSRQLAAELFKAAERLREAREALDGELCALAACAPHGDINSLLRRLDCLRGLHNQAEHGAFLIAADRALEAAWQRLP